MIVTQYIKAIIALFEVVLFSCGVFPAETVIDYGGGTYAAPVINTEMFLVDDGESDFVIVTEENPDECIVTASKELQKYIYEISGAGYGESWCDARFVAWN